MSPKQSLVIDYLRSHPTIDLFQAVEIVGSDIYTNERFHVGNLLGNMVKRGMIVRLKPGLFALPTAPAEFFPSPSQTL